MTRSGRMVVLLLGLGLVVLAALFWHGGSGAVFGGLPVFTFEQTDSRHEGYRRTTVSSGGTTYVNDYEEYALVLQNGSPTQAVGRAKFGGGTLCAIDGQPPAAYLAVDVGSEMPAYAVFRASDQPPFDWRAVEFQSMQFAVPEGRVTHMRTADPALIADVLATLRDGAPAAPQPDPGRAGKLLGLHLFSDHLPGLVFAPSAYQDETGAVYLSENLAVQTGGPAPRFHARWIPASPRFTAWVQTPVNAAPGP